jgi:CRP-like cAMP-binding protein
MPRFASLIYKQGERQAADLRRFLMNVVRTRVSHPEKRTCLGDRPIRNKLLLSVSRRDFAALRPHLEFLELPLHFALHEPNEKVRFAYFVNRGLASIVVVTRDGRNVEAGVAGCEGFTGSSLLGGLSRSPLREQMQIAGEGFRIDASAFEAALSNTVGLRAILTRYAVLQGMQVAQTAACNRLHQVSRRLARWLLIAQDRLGSATLPITHEFLATMLCSDRPGVSVAIERLQEKKALRSRRGVLTVVNRKLLEKAACECYQAIRQFDRQLGLR